MSKFKFNQKEVNHVLSYSKTDKVVVVEDGQIFEEKSLSYAKHYAKSKNLDWALANKKGLIQTEKTSKAEENQELKATDKVAEEDNKK